MKDEDTQISLRLPKPLLERIDTARASTARERWLRELITEALDRGDEMAVAAARIEKGDLEVARSLGQMLTARDDYLASVAHLKDLEHKTEALVKRLERIDRDSEPPKE